MKSRFPVVRRCSRKLLLLALAPLLVGCAVTAESASVAVPVQFAPVPLRAQELTLSALRWSPGVVASGGPAAPYNYGPTALLDNGSVRSWWCSQLPGVGPAGDDVLTASARDAGGPFAAGSAPAAPVFSGRPGGFDGMHTCDPSVLKVADRYYLYYTGAAGDHAHGNAIGVASSPDGLAWQRESGGGPIVRPAAEVRRSNVYGAGQPSALFLDGWFYLMFTDTTAAGAGRNGAGQFVLRARDAEFSQQVQRLGRSGFEGVRSTSAGRPRSIVDAFSADWMWVAALKAFAIAHQTGEGTTITFWDKEFTRHPYRPVHLPGPWQEGPGLVRGTDGHAPVSTSDPCGEVPLDVVRATTLNPAPSDIRYIGASLTGLHACATESSAAAVLDGFGIPSPQRTVDLVHGGAKVRFDRRSVAELLVRGLREERVPALDGLPVAATIRARAAAYRSADGELALLDDRGRAWLVPPGVPEANGSAVLDAPPPVWNALPVAGDLR